MMGTSTRIILQFSLKSNVIATWCGCTIEETADFRDHPYDNEPSDQSSRSI